MSGPTTPAQLRKHAAALLDEARAGTARATIAELARRAGFPRPTLYRNHPDIVADFLAQAAAAAAQQPEPPRLAKPTQQLVERIAKLRQQNEDLMLHIELYEEHIRRLTIENHRMSSQLAQLSNVTVLDHHRQQEGRSR
jgi:AcrR family transcriptional regulator